MKQHCYQTYRCTGLFLLVTLFFMGCSPSIKVISSWKSEQEAIDIFTSKKVLVISRTNSQQSRIVLEQELALELAEGGVEVLESFKKFPFLTPREEISEERRAEIQKSLIDEGFNGVVITTIIDERQTATTTTNPGSGVYVGGFGTYFPTYYGGFDSYYANPYMHGPSYGSYGGYVSTSSGSTTTSISSTYILETVGFNMDAPEDKRLVFVVSTSVKDPEDIDKAAAQYVDAIVESLRKKQPILR